MQLTCDQVELQKALSQVSRAVAKKSTLPVLTNVLLDAYEDTLQLSATNLEIAMTISIPATVVQGGQLTIRADVFSDFVNTLPKDSISMETTDPLTLAISCGKVKASIKGLSPDDFPTLPTFGDQQATARIPGELFKEMVGQVSFAAATDDSRPVLAGVYLEFQGTTVTLAAADGFRLSVREAELDEPAADNLAVIVPARSLNELARSVDDSDVVELLVTPSRSQLLARVGRLEFLTRLIDGHFPEFRQIIPKTWNTRVITGRDDFFTAARRARIFAQANNDVVRLQLVPGDSELDPGLLIVSAEASETGENEDLLTARVEGPKAQIAFNGRYLLEILSAIKTPEIAFEMTTPNAAGVFRPVGDSSFVHVIMPMVLGTL
ncbi:DNA polymerase III subunit beta [Thermorudis peleae]|uniref:DNA polymerase III subunit beta n=1 Tax=Thermorudis peleae TaxID=1382356 RepID=UPI000571299E|nr:DNA polymerase III subunit beta [Thermorudis peleae]